MSRPTNAAAARIVQARVGLVLDQPFFGALALRLAPQADPNAKAGMWTDGTTLGYNPEVIARWTDAELQGVVCHEVLHCALGHPWRRDGRDAHRWNMAADYAINPLISEAGMALPSGALLDSAYAGQAAEQIYAALPEPPPPPSGGEGDAPGEAGGEPSDDGDQPAPAGEVRDADPADPGQEAEWEVATFQAAQAAKAQGKLPAGMARLVEELRRPRVDWRAALRRFVQTQARDDYSWRMPATRYLAAGLYLPSLRSETMPPIVVGVDTSGSIGDAELADFAAELQAIMDECAPARIVVIYCDAAVNGVEEFERGDAITLSPHGGGGTDFRPVFDRVEAEGVEPACLVYLTDLDGTFPAASPDYPVLWVSTTRAVAPWGETIEMEVAP